MTTSVRPSRLETFERWTDVPMAILALLIVPALVLEETAAAPAVRTAATVINWVVWLAFCLEYLAKVAVAGRRRDYVRRTWFDLLIIALSPPFLVPAAWQGARSIRAVRALRLLRFVRAAAVAAIGLREAAQAFRHRRFHYVALVTVVVIGLGAGGILVTEGGRNKSIASFADALWWAVVTVTTVGYGDVSPITTEGRLIAVVLMIVGIGFIGVLTATLTSFFLEPERAQHNEGLEVRLNRIEAKLDRLLSSARDDGGRT